MSPTQLPNREGLTVPTAWLLSMLAGAATYGTVMVWHGALTYARIGDLEESVKRTDTYIANRVTSNEKRWEAVAGLRDQVIRVEEQNKLILDTLRRMENRR